MTTKKITMVDAMQIVRKGYKGCTSTAAVKNFCQKNNVACCWWKPANGKRTMLIEVTSFRSAYKANRTTSANSNTRTSSSRGNSIVGKNASTTRASNQTQSSWAKNAKTRNTRTNSRTNRTQAKSSSSTGRRLRKAA